MQRWIGDANRNGYKVIATYHRYKDNGSDDPNAVLAAAQWWKENYKALSKAGPFTINVINEWGGHHMTPEAFADAYNKAIPVLREFYKGPIIVDIPGWGQETVSAAKASSLIKDSNVVLSIHIYGSAFIEQGAHHWMQPSDLVALSKATDRPILIGEFGGMREGGADWRALVAQSKALGWTVLAWAWNGDGEDMNMVSPDWNVDCLPKAYLPTTYFAQIYAFLGQTPAPRLDVHLVEGDKITLSDAAQGYTFAIHGNTGWTVSVEGGAGWFDLSQSVGWGPQTLRFHVAQNKGTADRKATITVAGAGQKRTFTVCQKWHNPDYK
jgi:hypothetical protein